MTEQRFRHSATLIGQGIVLAMTLALGAHANTTEPDGVTTSPKIAPPDAPDAIHVVDARDTQAPSGNAQLLLNVLRETKLETGLRMQAALAMLDGTDKEAMELLAAELGPAGEATTQQLISRALTGLPMQPNDRFMWALLDLLWRAEEQGLINDVAAALGRYPDGPLVQKLIETASDQAAPQRQRLAAITALSHHRWRSVAGALLKLAETGGAVWVREASLRALGQLTGHEEPGLDLAKWRRWWAAHQGLSGEQWQAAIVQNFAHRTEDLSEKVRRVQERLAQVQRQLYRSLPQGDREAFLVEMLGDKLPSTRLLAIELVGQRLIDTQPIGQPLRGAVAQRLDDNLAMIRQRAAKLLHDLADEAGAIAVAQRLSHRREQDPDVLRAYLALMARLPQRDAVGRGLSLLTDEQLGAQAAGFLAAAMDAELVNLPQTREAAKRLRKKLADEQNPHPQAVNLLARVGNDDDWQQIRNWLDHEDEQVKRAAAEVWAKSQRSLEPLAIRAGDPVIHPVVVAAARKHGSDPKVLEELIKHQPDQTQAVEAWQRALLAMAGRMQVTSLLLADAKLAQQEGLSQLREQMLSVAIDSAIPNGSGTNGQPPAQDPDTTDTPGPAPDPAAPDLLMTRAELRLLTGEPSLAMADYQRVRNLQIKLGEVQSQRWMLGVYKARMSSGEPTAAFDVIEPMIRPDHGQPATDDHLKQVIETALAASERYIESRQHDQARAVLTRLRSVLGQALLETAEKRITELENLAKPAAEPTEG